MQMVQLKLVTIIAEALLEERMLEAIQRAGARGHSLSRVSGQGTRGIHASDWEGDNIKIETIVSPEVANQIIEHIAQTYFAHYAVIVYTQVVEVVRSEKYLGAQV
ncbi:transcriptional regulator [Candidatus Gracilibacteria bacterium]|nr:transcriptional regulator [Candidatus Gracilibacteria bacterium]